MAELFAPFNNGEPVVPSDVTNPNQPYTGIYIGGAGNLSYLDKGNHVVTLTAPPVGVIIRAGIKRVNATLTTCTLMVGFW